MENTKIYEYKYKKYKAKYLNLKNTKNIMLGGVDLGIEKTLYVSVGGTPSLIVYIPEEEFVTNIDIHGLFKKYEIDIKIDKNLDLETLRLFSKDNREKYINPTDPIIKYTHIANLSKLFEGAKEILKEYLPINTENYDDTQKWFGRNDEILRRIFSHHYEKRIVTDNPKEYSKIIFPERFLVIKDSRGTKISRNDTIKYIDSYFKISLDDNAEIYFEFDTEGYKIFNYTTYIEERNKKQPANLPINHEAYGQIIKLCEQLGTVDYTSSNVHYEDGIVYVKDLKNKGQNRCPLPLPSEKKESWDDFLKKLKQDADAEAERNKKSIDNL